MKPTMVSPIMTHTTMCAASDDSSLNSTFMTRESSCRQREEKERKQIKVIRNCEQQWPVKVSEEVKLSQVTF